LIDSFINHNKKTITATASGRLAEGILRQSQSPEHIYLVVITITDRQTTDKQNHTKDRKEQSGTFGFKLACCLTFPGTLHGLDDARLPVQLHAFLIFAFNCIADLLLIPSVL